MKSGFCVSINFETPSYEIWACQTWEDHFTKANYVSKNGIVTTIRGPHEKFFTTRKEAESFLKKEIEQHKILLEEKIKNLYTL
jgi:hypothetical protein